MPRQQKTASTTRTNKTKIRQEKPESPVKKKYFDETIEILDSDDDFKIPNICIKKRFSEKTFKLRRRDSAIRASTIDDLDVSSSLTDSDSFIQIDDDVNDDNQDNTIQDSNLQFGLKISSASANESWSGLMNRMQQNQKINSLLLPKDVSIKKTNDKKSTKIKLPLRKPLNTLALSSFAVPNKASIKNNYCSSNLYPQENSFSNLKQKFTETSTVIRQQQPSKKPKLELFASSSPNINFKSAVFKDDEDKVNPTLNNVSLLKVPAMFLKPAERAALAKVEKQEKSIACKDLCEALKLLSTEPVEFSSVNQTKDKFDGNVVKLYDMPVNAESDSSKVTKTKTCPFYKKLPGTRFSVDAFNYGQIPGVEVYFLSHFHSDHYIGLTKKFCKTLVCSPPTATLVRNKQNVDEMCIRRLQINIPYIIDGVEVTLINANHCPGSVMFIFKLATGVTYFHTGDFRFTIDMLENHILQGLKVDCLYLDTTYCDPQYNFPTQEKAIAELISVIKKKLEWRPKTLIVCGSYVIGKERVYFSLAEAIQSKVFMNSDKRRVIHCLENPIYSTYLTEKEDLASIHVQQMFSLTPKFLSDYLATRTAKYTNIIGIKPTGWQFTSSGDGSTSKSSFNDTVTIIGVPYSEHSSFSELEQFVKALKPKKVQPTVNVGNVSKREAMMIHINKWTKTNYG